MSDDSEPALLDHLRMARADGVGPRTARALRELLGSFRAACDLPPAELAARGVPARIARALHEPRLLAAVREELEAVRRAGDGLLGLELAGYPPLLAEIHDPPPVLAVRGELRPDDAQAVAVVGARRASPAATLFAHRLAHELALAGLTVVSGLARGIDQAAHEGALAAGGRTLAVLGAGLSCPLPAPALTLAARIAAGGGAVLSEFAPREAARKHTFPQRNRVIVGLSLGVVVVQASARSGALITAAMAEEEGREVFAVPGWPEDPLARGPNELIRDGARVVCSADDVLDVLLGVRRREPEPPLPEGPEAGAPAGDGTPGERLLAALSGAPRTLEELLAATGLRFEDGVVGLGRLEIERRAVRCGAGYVRA